MIELEDHAEAAVAEPVAAVRGKIVDPLAVEMDLAAVGHVERAQQVQERRLAAAALADDGQELALPHRQADAAEHGHFHRPLAIGLVQVLGQRECDADRRPNAGERERRMWPSQRKSVQSKL